MLGHALPSRDLLVAAHQQTTHEWWNRRYNEFECFISQVVIDEASAGNASEAAKRMNIIKNFPVLEFTDEAESLAMTILLSGKFPLNANS
ncbi:MAG: type II toxin-antitoxin system VapC family toxin [Desulfobacterales bacterium]|nr:type II toxin-antitoxin system VapC family toxin [Desulfobacterales bacterium]